MLEFIHFCHYAKRYAELYKKELKNSRVIFIDQKSKIALKPENVQLANHNFFWEPEYFSSFVTNFLKDDLPKNWIVKTFILKEKDYQSKLRIPIIFKIKKKF